MSSIHPTFWVALTSCPSTKLSVWYHKQDLALTSMKNSHDWACQAVPATLLHTTNLHNAPSTCMGNFMTAPREECQDDISAATSLGRPPSTSVKWRQIAEDQENIPLVNNTAYPHVRKASYRCYIVLIVLAILQNLVLIYLHLRRICQQPWKLNILSNAACLP